MTLFKEENEAIYKIPVSSQLLTYLRTGISCLKTVHCGVQSSSDCVICHDSLLPVASRVPRVQRVVSSLICRVSGQVMDENNVPVLLPNGQVYS